jgi:hypothetical protein
LDHQKPGDHTDQFFKAFEWVEMEKDAERGWYDQDEEGVIDEGNENQYFLGDREKFRAIE